MIKTNPVVFPHFFNEHFKKLLIAHLGDLCIVIWMSIFIIQLAAGTPYFQIQVTEKYRRCSDVLFKKWHCTSEFDVIQCICLLLFWSQCTLPSSVTSPILAPTNPHVSTNRVVQAPDRTQKLCKTVPLECVAKHQSMALRCWKNRRQHKNNTEVSFRPIWAS